MNSLRTAVVLAAALVSAPLAGQGGCTTTVQPGEELALSADSAIVDELFDAVHAAARDAGVAEPRGYLALVQDARGRAEIHLHRSNVPERVVRQVQRAMAGRLAEAAGPDGRVFINRRIDAGTLPSAPLPQGPEIVECRPLLLEPHVLPARLLALLERSAPEGNPQMWISLRMWVTPEGDVAYAGLLQPTGSSRLDRVLVRDFARGLRFAPGTVNGVPVPVWVELPLQIPFRAPRERSRRTIP
jgi:hypothetical protein